MLLARDATQASDAKNDPTEVVLCWPASCEDAMTWPTCKKAFQVIGLCGSSFQVVLGRSGAANAARIQGRQTAEAS